MGDKLEQLVPQLAQSQIDLQKALKDAHEASREALQQAQLEASDKLAQQQLESNAKLAEQQLKFQQDLQQAKQAQQQEIAQVVQALGGIAGLPADNAVAIRTKAVLSMRKEFRKSQLCKRFAEKQDLKPQDWLKRFEAELDQQRAMSGVPDPLRRTEWIPCFQDKLEFEAKERLQTAMARENYDWAGVTVAQIKELLVQEFGIKESKVSEVLLQFGPGRFKKPSEMGVAAYYHKFKAQLPTCMMPVSEAECKEFVDLIQRSIFYYNLEDSYLQEELCKIKEDDQKLETFLDSSVKAEANRKAFQDI